MSIMTAREAIEALKQCDPDETLLITYWGDTDFTEYKDRDQALELAEQQLDSCVAHVNEWVASQYENETDWDRKLHDELCDECGAPHEEDVKVRS